MTLELRNLLIGYEGRAIAAPIQACLGDGDLCALLGGNGVGKSTLMRTIAQLQPSLGGQIVIDGEEAGGLSSVQLSRKIGIVTTHRVSSQGLLAREVVEMGRSPYTNFWGRLTTADREAVDEAIHEVGIELLQNRKMATLSDGERQKVMLAKVLAQQTPIILLDEPTAFLDFPSKADTMLLLQRLCREMGKAVLLSTHDLDLALQTSTRLWLMQKGEPLTDGTPLQLAKDGRLAQTFQGKNIFFDKAELRFRISN